MKNTTLVMCDNCDEHKKPELFEILSDVLAVCKDCRNEDRKGGK